MTRAVLLLLALAGCAQTTPEAACLVYAQQRATMPPLGMSALDEWVSVTDSALTAACFP